MSGLFLIICSKRNRQAVCKVIYAKGVWVQTERIIKISCQCHVYLCHDANCSPEISLERKNERAGKAGNEQAQAQVGRRGLVSPGSHLQFLGQKRNGAWVLLKADSLKKEGSFL